MQDRKALQAGTSHFLGQNFARAQGIKFQSQEGREEFAWTTSWGVSTRLVGALIMTHSEDDGLVLPPKLAPQQIVLLPIYKDDEQQTKVLSYCEELKQQLESQRYDGEPIRVQIDDRDLRGGEKNWYHVKRGVPLRAEIGPRDIEQEAVFLARRDTGSRDSTPRGQLVEQIEELLEEIQQNLFQKAQQVRTDNTRTIDDAAEFKEFFTPRTPRSQKFMVALRSEERRVGKECRSRWSP